MVFCDLVDSTPIAAKLDPEDFGEIINEFQSTCAKVISSFDGYTARFMGDGVLAYFGYPRAQEDDAGRAVRAALRLVEAVGLLKPKKLNERLRSRVGIATGLVVIDTLLGSAVSEQAAFGETPNLAARLQGAAEANSILIAESTFKLVSRQFIFSPEKTRQLKGIEKPVRTWTVISESAVESRFGSNHSEALTPFVGRIDEIELLVKLWERTKRPEGQVALISGEAGIGKSRLVEALHEALSNERHVAVRYQCSPYHTNSPLRPVINQIEFSAGFERDDNPQTRLAKLETFLNSSSAASNSDFALYGDLLSIPGAARHPIAEMTPRKSKELTISALIRYLLKLSESRPLLLIVEDAHWIDPTTLELLDRLIQDMHASKVYVLVTTRPDFVAPWGDLPNSTNIRLNRLSREHCAALLRNMTDGKELPIEVHEHIVSKTDGIPLFVEELTRTVLESGIMAEQDDRFTMSGALPTLAIPATLQDSLMSRLDRLGSSREIAQIGAALGRTFPHQLIAAVAPISEAALRNSLDQLTAADLIYRRGEPPDATYIFRHALVQDVAYESLLRSRRSQLHSRISDVLTGQFMQSVETEPEIMAHHLARAGRIEEAIAYLRKAGERAIRRSANVEAIRHLQRGLELLKQLPESSERQQVQLGIDVILGQALIAGRGYAASETRDVLLRAKELLHVLTEPSDRFAVLYGIWACYYVGGEVRLQQAAASEFLAAAEKADDTAALCIAHRALGTTYVTMGEFATGRWHLEQARSLYDPDRHSALPLPIRTGYRHHCTLLSMLGLMASRSDPACVRGCARGDRLCREARSSAHHSLCGVPCARHDGHVPPRCLRDCGLYRRGDRTLQRTRFPVLGRRRADHEWLGEMQAGADRGRHRDPGKRTQQMAANRRATLVADVPRQRGGSLRRRRQARPGHGRDRTGNRGGLRNRRTLGDGGNSADQGGTRARDRQRRACAG